ncbi:MAG: Fe-S cluster assembly protein SufD [Kangiellaceae bacterium]|nr:Fe-S cluster assembly protein SufD [Kangiellaceae bacterium]
MNISLQNSTAEFLNSGSSISESLTSTLEDYINSSESTPDWLKTLKLNSIKSLSDFSIPSRKMEHWKYNDISSVISNPLGLKKDSELAKQPSTVDLNKLNLPLMSSVLCVFIDGEYSEGLSNLRQQEGFEVTTFKDASETQIEEIKSSLVSAAQQKNLFIQINDSVSMNGLYLKIDANKKSVMPIYLIYLSTNDDSQLTNNQVVINCNQNSQSCIVEHFINLNNETEDSSQLACQQTILELGENSHCDHYRISTGSKNINKISRLLVKLAKDSNLSSFHFSEGAVLDKTDIDVWHQGSNSESKMTGIYLPSEKNQIDFHTCVEHQVPHCNSRETFRGIIADSSSATFNGKIHIFKDAQKSDAQLSNKNLLLTNQAQINTKPELEIYADDVVCAHGATIAKIDEKAVYYLKSRGISETQAKKMLSVGFINELLDEINQTELHKYLTDKVQSSLSNLK